LNLKEIGIDNGVIIGPGLRERLKEEMFTWYVSIDHYMLRYMRNRGFFRNDILSACQHCGETNSREHAADECEWYSSLREDTMDKIRKVTDVKGMTMPELLMKFYFDHGEIEKKARMKINRYLKEFVYQLYGTQEKRDRD
jgi:hypothetical protein